MSNEDKLNDILNRLFLDGLSDGGTGGSHEESVDKAKTEISKLIDEETTKARISEIENVINMPVEYDDFDVYLPYRLKELKNE